MIDPAMLDAFEEQVTEDSFRSVLACARRRAALTAATDDAVVLVQDAITDTLAGVARWEPAARPLAAHLCDLMCGGAPDDDDAPPPWRPVRRDVFDLLDFTRVRLELAWRNLRDQARAAREARRAARTIDVLERSDHAHG